MYWIIGTLALGAVFIVWVVTHNAMDYDPEWDQPWEEDTDDDPG